MVVMGLPTGSVITPDDLGILAQGTCAGNGQGDTFVSCRYQKTLDEAHDVMDDKTVRAPCIQALLG